jgi:hypothetical protein
MATQTLEIVCTHAELNWRNDSWCRNCAKAIVWHTEHIHHDGDTPAWPYVGGRSTARDIDQRLLDRTCQQNWVVCYSSAQTTSSATQEQN